MIKLNPINGLYFFREILEMPLLELSNNESLIILGLIQSHMDYIIRDVSRLSKEQGTEKIREFYVEMLLECHSLHKRINAQLNSSDLGAMECLTMEGSN